MITAQESKSIDATISEQFSKQVWNLNQSIRERLRLRPLGCQCAPNWGCEPGETFRCEKCDKDQPYCRGQDDEYFELCDDCWFKFVETPSRIAGLNDRFRRGDDTLGHRKTSPMVQALSLNEQRELIERVRSFDELDEEDASNQEHNFGSIEFVEQVWHWKIEYYDTEVEYGAEDPSDPRYTIRILNIMHSSES